MNVSGVWNLVAFKKLNEKLDFVWVTNEELNLLPDDDFAKQMADVEFRFEDDGKLSAFFIVRTPIDQIPEEELKKALDSGEAVMSDGVLKINQPLKWKSEGDKIFVDNGERGEILGEAINPWKEAEILGNTLIICDMYQIVRKGETPSDIKKTVPIVKEGTPEMKAVAGTYKGLYTKFVGDGDSSKNTDEEFTLILNPDGTGTHKRNNLEINIPDWTCENGEFKMTEKFLGTIDYVGKIEGNKLNIFNGDPTNNFTCEYVYDKE